MAGQDYTNVYPEAHIGIVNGSPVLIEVKPRVHRGSLGIDATAGSAATGTSLSAISIAAKAPDLPAFANAVEAAWGSGYRQAVAPVMGDFAASIAALPPAA